MKIQEVYEEVEKMTDNYFCVSYKMNRHTFNNVEIECSIYIKGFGHFDAPTFALALDKVKEAMGKIKPDILDIDR